MASWGLTSKLETDVEIKASAKDFHDMWFKKPHHVSNTCNDKVHGCDLHEGEFGKVGSIVVWHYTHDGVKKVAKDVIEAVDEANNSITFKVIEGDVMKAYKNFVIHIQATPKSDGNGCIVHWIVEYEKLHKSVPHPETFLQFVIDVSKDIDAHLTSAAKASSGLTGKLETDVEIKASAKDFHDMFWSKPHHVSNTCNDKIHACDLHEGEYGKVGSILVWHYTHDGVRKVAKEVIEAVDEPNNAITFRVIEGDLMKEYKTFVIHIQASPKSDGNGCIVHCILEYEKLHKGVDHPETLLQFAADVSRDIDAHLTSSAKSSSGLTGKLETDVEIKASAKDFHDMFMNKPHHVSNTCNDKVHGCDLHAGEWGKVGSIISWNYTHDGVKKVEKEVIEAVDEEKNSITFRVIEGDLMKEYKKFVIHVQATPKSNGSGCIAHWIVEYEKLHGGVAHPETFMQFLVDVSKDVDTHLCK